MKHAMNITKKRLLTLFLVLTTAVIILGAGTASAKSLPKDKGRIVFQGRIRKVSHSKLLKIQKEKDPNPGYSDKNRKYYIIQLTRPQNMTLNSVDGMYRGLVKIIDASYTKDIEKYVGKTCTISINPKKTEWPSDTSLPLGQPRTSDLHIRTKKGWTKLKSKLTYGY